LEFGSALFLVGITAAAIPVVLHLIRTTRAPRTPFPTLRFLKIAAAKTARRRRVQNIFLLLMRMLLFALLALALARPFLTHDLKLLSTMESPAVVILDNSMSQGVTFGGRTRLQHSKQEAEALLTGRFRPSEVLLLVADGPPSRQEPRWLRDRDLLIRRIRQSEAGFAGADLAALLQTAYRKIDEHTAAGHRIYILTDMQRRAWSAVAEMKEIRDHPQVPVCVIGSSEAEFSNVAVTDVRLLKSDRVVGFPLPIEIRLASTPEVKGQRNLNLYIDDMSRPRERRAVEMPIVRGRNDRLILQPSFATAGRHRLRIEIDAEDSLPVDNARRLVVDIAGEIRVLLVSDSGRWTDVDDPLYYLERALTPAADDATWAIQAESLTPDALTAEALLEADVIVIAEVADLSDESRGQLRAFVAAGNTLIVFPGRRTDVAQCNRVERDDEAGGREALALLPAKLIAPNDRAAIGNPARHVTEVAGSAGGEDLMAGLDDLRYYERVLVQRHYLLRPREGSSAQVLLRLDNGDPLLVESALDRGRVYLFAVPASGDWSNLQRKNIFLPLVLRMVHRSVERRRWPAQVVSGRSVTLDYAPAVSEALSVLVNDPEHATTPKRLQTDPRERSNTVRISETFALGFYDVRPQGRPESDHLAWTFGVNPDGRESDLAPIRPQDLEQLLPARELYVADSIADLQQQLKSLGRRELWMYFFIMVLLLTLLECLISNRLRPKTETGGVATLVDRLLGRSPRPTAEAKQKDES